jgi:hypothetical protein
MSRLLYCKRDTVATIIHHELQLLVRKVDDNLMFRGRTTNDGAARKREIKAWVIEALALPAEATVMVTELACKEPGCPPIETVIAVLRGPKDTLQFKAHRAAVDLDKDAVVALLRGAEPCEHDEDHDVPPLDISDEQS